MALSGPNWRGRCYRKHHKPLGDGQQEENLGGTRTPGRSIVERLGPVRWHRWEGIGLTARVSCRPHLASGKCLLFSEPQHPAAQWVGL